MAPQDAAQHLMRNIKESAQPVLDAGHDAVVPIILDGENAWEYYPQSGREFLRRFYDALQRDPGVEATTVSEAIQRHQSFSPLKSLVPGSWIHANFNVWIGAPEDNRAWDYLYHARNFYAQAAPAASEAQRQLAFEEILIAEGSDWNWWYGPEHHSANDREFDELYRKHLSNIYQLLGSRPPDYLSQPLMGGGERPAVLPQTAYIHPRITGDMVRYFEWMGAAVYTADRRAGAMHGKQFLLDAVYAGIDEAHIYGRLDFVENKVPSEDFEIVVNLESSAAEGAPPPRTLRLDVAVAAGRVRSWKVSVAEAGAPLAASDRPTDQVAVALLRNFEFKLPLGWLQYLAAGSAGETAKGAPVVPATAQLKLRFSLWQNGLPADALPVEGWMELQLLREEDLIAL
jgi:hypothetical protein